MCGIWTYIDLLNIININIINKAYSSFISMKNRGPDLSIYQVIKNNIIIGFHRLGIMDLTFHANQPFIIEDNQRTIVFICNGEIYNFKELIVNHNLPITNNSDCMTIPQLYIKYYKNNSINDFLNLFTNEIKGEFAFILLEFDHLQNLSEIIIGRDKIGIRPLYYHKPNNKSTKLLFSSEIKGMTFFDDNIEEFNPGNLMSIKIDNITNQFKYNYYNFNNIYNIKQLSYFNNINGIKVKNEYFSIDDYDTYNLDEINYNNTIISQYLEDIRNSVINSVKRRLISEKPIAFLLSGGVDSSLVAAIASKLLKIPINTFCCGMTEGTDLLYARKVAEHIKSNHTEVFFTEKEGLEVLDDVIYTTETWDTTTIRASVGQYLVCKHIGTKTDSKVIMVGEGPDEVCSSYLFNYYAPNGKELHEAAIDYVKNIHIYDGRRADRCISRWGLEGRVALLDPEFIEAYWKLPSEWRHPKYKGIEKWWLRKAFESTNILPPEVLWRKKEAFSDGISGKTKSWFEIIQDHIKTIIPENEYKTDILITAPTIESYYYKKKFIEYFGINRLNIIPGYWQPKWTINNTGEIINTTEYVDPSARTLKVYDN